MSQSFNNNINSLNTVTTTVNVSNNFTISDDGSNILAWLSPLDPRLRHQDIRDRRVENIGEWLLQAEEFRSWCVGVGGGETDNAVLFGYGDPGVGKTFISSLVIDSLCDQAQGQGIAVACFYFDFAGQKEQSPTGMLGALLKQIVSGLGEVPGEIARAYEDQKKVLGGRGPLLADIVKMLQITSSEKRIFICIDALDECVAGYRIKVLHSLNQILQKSPTTRIFVTGRPHIQPEIGKCLSGRVKTISITPRRGDIISYLHNRLSEDTTPDAMDSSLEADILKKIPDDISEIFLLVSLNIDAILQETTIYRRRQKLNMMTDGLGLGDAYGATLSRIRGQGGEKARLGMAALMWISHSERPLKPDELCHALAVEIGSPSLNTDNVSSIGTLLACCQGLVVVDKEASTVRLIHFTLQEYLRAHPELFATAHSTLAETCLSYLNSHQVNALSPTPSPDSQSTPFLEYSSPYWGTHAKRDLSDCAKLLALKLFDNYNNHTSIKFLLEAQTPYYYAVDFNRPLLFSGLHCASMFGIVEIVASLIEMEGCDVTQKDCVGNTPLAWAAENGHEGVAKILLRRDEVNPGERGKYGQTPLCCAARNGHEGVVSLLLGRDDVNPNKPNSTGQTPLYCAAQDGHEGVVKILLGRDDVNPDKTDMNCRTPLYCAAWNGYERVVSLLLERDDVNPDKPDSTGQTPLYCAAQSGYEGVVKVLLGRDDVNPDKPNSTGQTPLCCAARNRHEGVVKILLGRGDVNPNKPDKHGQTPLYCAAYNGHEGMVSLLLGRDDINPDKPNSTGQTPLCFAAQDGHEGVVKVLLGRNDVNPDKPDKYGQTPLLCAVRNGHEGVVSLLLGQEDVNPDKPNSTGQTLLCCAARSGHEGVVKVLLGRDDINPDEPDKFGQAPLYCAAWNGHEGVVKILLGRDDVNPNKPNSMGQTPLCCAARNGHDGVAKVLLGRDDINPDEPDEFGQTPLCCAALNGHEAVVKVLLERRDINPDKPTNDGQTPLFLAAGYGNEGVVKLLLKRDDVSLEKPDNYGVTPLLFATKRSHARVVSLLMSQGLPLPEQPHAE